MLAGDTLLPEVVLVLILIAVKLSFTLEQTIKAQMGSRGIALLFL